MPKAPKTLMPSSVEHDGGDAPGMAPPTSWPAYGYMNETFMYDVRTRRVPVGFLIGGQPADDAGFTKWLEDFVDEMAEYLWPRYVPGAPSPWKGAALAVADKLTSTDFELMGVLREQLEKAPSGRDKSMSRTHLALFVDEDDKAPWPTYAEYETKLTPELMSSMQAAMQKTNGNFGPAPLRFKALMQRPRPYQVAFMQSRKDFRYEYAKSAVTPSIISGHAVQGLLAGTGGYIRHLRELRTVADAVQHLQQYAVDVGDRRVFAGVHYPSDNLASWLVALRLCDQGFFGELKGEAQRFIAGAIVRSAVYKAMSNHGGVYATALGRLKDSLGSAWPAAAV